MAHVDRIMYVELKSGDDRGPAWIGRVRTSKTGRTVYCRGRTLRRKQGASGNHVDIQSGRSSGSLESKRTAPTDTGLDRGRSRSTLEIFDEYLGMVNPSVKARILDRRR